MDPNIKFEIKPDYKKRKRNVNLILYLSVNIIVFSIVYSSPLFVILGFYMLIVMVFIPKKYMVIENNSIIIESNFLISALNSTAVIDIKDIQEAFFVKGQFRLQNLFSGGHDYIDYEYNRVLTTDKIVLNLKNKRHKNIYKIGNLEQFKEAYNTIQSLIDLNEQSIK